METELNRQFRGVKIDPGTEIKIWSGKTGDPVTIQLKNLNNYQREILSKACDFILGKLKGGSFEEPVTTLMQITGFCTTTSNHVSAYGGKLVNDHIVVLNSKTFSFTNDEFAVTILHELLHFLEKSDDRNPLSLEEARHDLACYGLLGVRVPLDHWAWTEYPDLKDEILSDAEK
jgi:hypothetical protein